MTPAHKPHYQPAHRRPVHDHRPADGEPCRDAKRPPTDGRGSPAEMVEDHRRRYANSTPTASRIPHGDTMKSPSVNGSTAPDPVVTMTTTVGQCTSDAGVSPDGVAHPVEGCTQAHRTPTPKARRCRRRCRRRSRRTRRTDGDPYRRDRPERVTSGSVTQKHHGPFHRCRR
jgi:hypothetical protein